MSIDPNKFGISKSLIDAVNEALKGGQVKIDKNHNGKIDSQDFKMLRKEELKGNQTKIDKNHNGKIDSQDFKMLRKEEEAIDEKRGLWDNIHAKQKRIKAGSGEHMRKPGSEGAPSNKDLRVSRTEETNLDEKSVSKAQQHAAGAALATQRGEYDGGKKGGAINRMASMKTSELRKFAGTKTKGLPTHKEEVEQVDELSKTTLGSYIKKASHDVATKSAATGRYADRANAVKDQMKKGDYSNYQQGKKDDATADKMFNKSWKRRAGIAKATDKLTKEDFEPEPVNELSTDTYHSAAHKAAKKAMGDAQGRSGPIFKKYAGMANKFRDKGMSQEKKEKAMKEENIDEAGRVLPDLTQKEPEKKHSKDYLSRMPKKRDSGLWKAYVKTGAKWAKPDHVKEESLDEIQGVYGNGGNKKNLKIIHKGEVVKDYGTDTKPNKASRDKKAEKMKAYRADRDKNMEEEIQIDEISKGTLASYGYKAGRQMQGNQPSDPDKFRKRANREKGSKLAYGKYYGYKVKVPATEETDPGFAEAKTMTKVKTTKDIGYKVVDVGPGQKEKIVKAHNWTEPKKKLPNGADYAAQRRKERLAANGRMDEATENPMAKQLADKKAAIQKTIVQKKMQVMQSKANKQMSSMKEGKCSCMEGKKSMTCEVHGDNSKDKFGKEKIELNPPLRD
jgi:hypothetical protein